MLIDENSETSYLEDDFFRPRVGERAGQAQHAGMTAEKDVMGNHLFRFGEFACMYLFSWSDVLWNFPSASNNPNDIEKIIENEDLINENYYLKSFLETIPEIRRAMANIPTYMMFDDHDVTDDWNLHKSWCMNVFETGLGPRILTNALMAYSVFQHWGNAPVFFSISSAEEYSPGRRLLNEMAKMSAMNYNEINKFINLNSIDDDSTEMSGDRNVGLFWDYSASWNNHQLLALDTRTTRSWPNGELEGYSELLSPSSFERQIEFWAQNYSIYKKVTLVVVPSPVFGVPRIEEKIMEAKKYHFANELTADMESWSLQEKSRQNLLSSLQKSSQVFENEKMNRIIFLSGDVHYGFANRCEYWADKPFGSNSSDKSHLLFVQLNASSLKNQSTDRVGWIINTGTQVPHNGGYDGTQDGLPEPFLLWGYNNSSKATIVFGSIVVLNNNTTSTKHWESKKNPIVVTNKNDRILLKQPDWCIRIDYFKHENPPKNQEREQSMLGTVYLPGCTYLQIHKNLDSLIDMNHGHEYTAWNGGKAIVGKNNIGEIFFEWGDNENDKFVNQWLWWEQSLFKREFLYSNDPNPFFKKSRSSLVGVVRSYRCPFTQYRIPLGLSHPTDPNAPKYSIPIPKPAGF